MSAATQPTTITDERVSEPSMRRAQFRLTTAAAGDADRLAGIRVEAMRPSLEAVGRFDPDRARDRFLKSFRPDETTIIHAGDNVAGFFVLRAFADHFYLDHIYVVPAFQGMGIGRLIMDNLKAKARAASLPIRLMALNGSPANDFYRGCGFTSTQSDTLDTHYVWRPEG
ncbi:MAG: GNAT family N-acetyltransferase [Salinarimonas sp.]